jgi:3-oxoacyl-[acyl-carrier-protein] synthase II
VACNWRIAVTGIGLVTPLGLTAIENVAGVLGGETGIRIRPVSEGATAAAVPPKFDISTILRHPKNVKLLSRPVQMALKAVREALDQSGLPEGRIASDRTGVYVASGQTGLEYDEFFKGLTLAWEGGREQDYKYLGGMPSKFIDRYFSLRTLSNGGVGAISTEFGARGPSNNYVQGETAAAVAIYNASLDLEEERCDAAIVSAYESLLVPSTFISFRKMELLSGGGLSPDYRPFNTGRPGMVLGEGACALILERLEDASARGAIVLAVIEAVGLASQTADVEGLTAAPDDIRAAIEGANVPDAKYLFARGLGTEADDLAEGQALAEILPEAMPVSALKGQTGYLGAATAAIELAIGLLCARQGAIPAIRGLDQPDPRIPLNFLREPAPLPDSGATGLFLSSTFGGQVAAIAARAIP